MLKIGVDIGGTNIKGILVDEDNKILKSTSKPTNGKVGREAIKKSLFEVIDFLFCNDVKLIGVSSAGNIDPNTGVCVYATDNLKGWTGYDIKSDLENKYSVKTIVDNDAVCALKAELDNYPDAENVVMITFGTGIGGAVMSGGKIIRGKNFDGGRLGHIVLVPGGRPCNCGKLGCAETYLSCTALKTQADKKSKTNGVRELFDLYRLGNENAIEVIKEFSYYLNIFLDNIRTAYSPEYIILGGGLAANDKILLSLINDKTGVEIAKYANQAGALGALKTTL